MIFLNLRRIKKILLKKKFIYLFFKFYIRCLVIMFNFNYVCKIKSKKQINKFFFFRNGKYVFGFFIFWQNLLKFKNNLSYKKDKLFYEKKKIYKLNKFFLVYRLSCLKIK